MRNVKQTLCWGALLLLMLGCPSREAPGPGPSSLTPPPPVVEHSPTPDRTPSAGPSPKQPAELVWTFSDQGALIKLPWLEGELWRGYQPITERERANIVYTKFQGGQYLDPAPHGIELYYLARGPQGEVAQCRIPPQKKTLTASTRPRIQVDKSHYTLTVFDGDTVAKRFPIALGANPTNRKFCQDYASTPEGLYRIYNLQPQATFYKAFDIDYPNPIDHVRHELAIKHGEVESSRPIGGEIQIHGLGVHYNWTHGCMALRDTDIDQLFSRPELGVNTEVFISGSQIQPDDREWIRAPDPEFVKSTQRKLAASGFYRGSIDGDFGPATARALGLFQQSVRLPVSCQLDAKTREFLGKPRP